MPRIRIEWVPVQMFGLGLLGFDHLQLVYQQSDADIANGQDAWFVMEGVRETRLGGAYLGIEGADGRTTLSVANLAARNALVAKIGTPEYRGSRALPYGGDEFQAWETMASYARDIDTQDFPYIAYGLPGSPTPTINSSSAIASLIYYSGLDPSARLPYGLHLSPGIATRLGTSGDDAMRVECGFTTLLGGSGRDEFIGGSAPHVIDKLYGGTGDDLFHWSAGFNIIHGGQPNLGYAADGVDVIDYSGAGTVVITSNRHWVPHKSPNYVALSTTGRDHLYSIERIQWNETTDRIVLGDGIDLVEDDVILEGAHTSADPDSSQERSSLRSGRLVDSGIAPTSRLVGDDERNVLTGTAGDDTLYGGAGDDRLAGGPGSDGYVYLPGDGSDVIIEGGEGADIDELILGGGIAPAQVSLHRPSQSTDDLVLTLVGGGRILIADFFKGPATGIERIVFDDAPPWDRDDLLRLAASALVDDDEAPSPAADYSAPRAPPYSPAGSFASADHGEVTFVPETTLGDLAGPVLPASGLWLGLDAHWLF
jgi:Ca2+-binding RTX toxin-like protein